MDIIRLLPKNQYDAALGANAPSAANVFATMADLSGVGGNGIYSGAGIIPTNTVATITDNISFNGGEFRTENGYWQGTAKILYINPNATPGNLFVGENSGNATMTGSVNVGLGKNTLMSNTTGVSNVAIGVNSMQNNTTGLANVAIGSNSLLSNTIGTYNTSIGLESLQNNTTGNFNTSIGRSSLLQNSTGNSNTSIGYASMDTTSSVNENVAIGMNTLRNTQTDGQVAIGYNSLVTNTTGVYNTSVGYNSLSSNTTGGNNTALGSGALAANTTGASNTAIGDRALGYYNNGSNNTSIGYLSMYQNTTGSYNVAIGDWSLSNLTTGTRNTVIHTTTGLTTGSYNQAIGYNAMSACLGTVLQNTAIGTQALQLTQTNNQVAIGYNSMATNITGTFNTALGNYTLYNNITGSYQVAIGYQSLYKNRNGLYNTAIGYNSLTESGGQTKTGSFVIGVSYTISIVGDTDFTLIGAASNTIGIVFTATGVGGGTTGYAYPNNINGNTAIGYQALTANTVGTSNTAVGYLSLSANTTGLGNIAFGYKSGVFNTTESNQLYIHNGLGVTDLATGKSNSLIYGIFDAATANQYLNINANTNTPLAHYNYMAASNSADTVGDVRFYATYVATVSTFFIEKCTVANATKGGGTWVLINSFGL